jgi:hypothetical protein
MLIGRRARRLVLPSVLALGLVAAGAVGPVDAQDAAPPTGVATTATAPVSGAGNLGVTVPSVAFTQRITRAGGRLRTAVLVNVAAPAGVATIVGIPDCRVAVRPGVPVWLDCPDRRAGELTVAVALEDGTRVTHSVVPTAG